MHIPIIIESYSKFHTTRGGVVYKEWQTVTLIIKIDLPFTFLIGLLKLYTTKFIFIAKII